MYPATGFTKGQVIDYYARVAPVVLPYASGRPLTLKRFPDGVGGAYFFERQCPRHRPDWIETVPIWTREYAVTYRYCVASEPASLVWLANLANLELHATLGRGADLIRPTAAVFDLDPGHPAGLIEACRVALRVRGMLAELGLACFAKSSGSKGMHVYAPLDSSAGFGETKAFARVIAGALAAETPSLVTADVARARRRGRVLVDWSQNDRHRTIVAPYSLRATHEPGVSTPLHWEEVVRAVAAGDPSELITDPATALLRVERDDDPFAPVATLRQRLPGI